MAMYSYSKTLFILIVSLQLTSCSVAAPKPTLEKHEAAIYSFLLDRNPEKHSYITGTPIVISGETEYYDVDKELLARFFPTLEETTFEDYQKSNEAPHTIDLPLTSSTPYVLVSRSELDDLIEYGNWEKFNQKFPETHGVVFFSKIGFNKEGTQALVFMGYSCGGECGIGNIYLFNFNGTEWQMKRYEQMWIS